MELALNSKWRTSFSESGGNFGQSQATVHERIGVEEGCPRQPQVLSWMGNELIWWAGMKRGLEKDREGLEWSQKGMEEANE